MTNPYELMDQKAQFKEWCESSDCNDVGFYDWWASKLLAALRTLSETKTALTKQAMEQQLELQSLSDENERMDKANQIALELAERQRDEAISILRKLRGCAISDSHDERDVDAEWVRRRVLEHTAEPYIRALSDDHPKGGK